MRTSEHYINYRNNQAYAFRNLNGKISFDEAPKINTQNSLNTGWICAIIFIVFFYEFMTILKFFFFIILRVLRYGLEKLLDKYLCCWKYGEMLFCDVQITFFFFFFLKNGIIIVMLLFLFDGGVIVVVVERFFFVTCEVLEHNSKLEVFLCA